MAKYNRIKHIKELAKDLAEMNGVEIKDFDGEDIEYIGMEAQCNYADVAEILGLELPEYLGPVLVDNI
jgi:hypothetical protein